MNKLKAFIRLAPKDRALLLQAFVSLISCKIRLRFQNFENLATWATQMGRGAAPVERLAWAVDIALRLMPASTCLCQALVLQRLLARNGHNSELRIGVKKSSHDDFSAHAWLMHNGEVLVGGSQLDHYAELKSRNNVATGTSVGSRTV